MREATMVWPRKTRETQNCICDSTRWNGFKFRDDDVVIATYAKTGTTWTQQIVGKLVFRGAEFDAFAISPWVDFRLHPLDQVMGMLEAQNHRRFLKTHLPLDALVFAPEAKYLYVGRDGRDAAWSLYNHHAGLSDRAYELINSLPGRVGPPLEGPAGDIVQYFHDWLDGGGLPLGGSFWEHNQGWWDAQHLPNVLLVHFNCLKADLPAEMRRIASFLGIEIGEELWPTLVEHCTFDYMRKAASTNSPLLDVVFQGGANTFFHEGTNGRWRDVLSSAEVRRYEEMALAKLTPECAHWVATGEMTRSVKS
jgi:aryl sulfotransferase